MLNDIIGALDKKQHCAALFVDLSKAFDSVNHELLLNKLSSAGFGPGTLKWFRNYLVDRTQCVHVKDLKSGFLDISKGVPRVPFWDLFCFLFI